MDIKVINKWNFCDFCNLKQDNLSPYTDAIRYLAVENFNMVHICFERAMAKAIKIELCATFVSFLTCWSVPFLMIEQFSIQKFMFALL